jgi:hypothetical protein
VINQLVLPWGLKCHHHFSCARSWMLHTVGTCHKHAS